MKKLLQICAVLGLFFSMTSATCSPDTPEPDEPEMKDYTCYCVYVPSDTSQANKEEYTTIRSAYWGSANVDCGGLQGKYHSQFYSGSCVLQ
jgi:hypothetical protein